MSMPVIRPSRTTRKQAITDLIASIALEEAALAHILNAEGEKLQAVIGMKHATKEDLLKVNKSVECMVKAITSLEMILKSKLDVITCDLMEEEKCGKGITEEELEEELEA